MLYLKELPEITSSTVDKRGLIELEVRGQVEQLPPDRSDEDIVFVGNLAGAIYLVIGHIAEYEYIEPDKAFEERDFTRLKIAGICATVLDPY